MLNKIAIVGAGHAGVSAASALIAKGYAVDLFSNEAGLPYFRPRLLAVAFGQAEPEAIAIKPESFYTDKLRLVHAAITSAEALKGYRSVILTQGAIPFIPPFQGETSRLCTLWTMNDALAIREKAKPGMRITILGGGVLGLEAALRAALAGLTVTLVEVAPHVANGVLGEHGSQVLEATLRNKGIVLSLGTKVQEITATGILLENGSTIEDDILLCSTGARSNTRLAETFDAEIKSGLATASDLSFAPHMFAAGDMAQPTAARPICAVRRATAMGALAAENCMAQLEARPTTPWSDPLLPLFMKVDEVEFHTFGTCLGEDLEEKRIDDATNPACYQSILYRGERPVGLRFVGTRAGFADWEKQILAAHG